MSLSKGGRGSSSIENAFALLMTLREFFGKSESESESSSSDDSDSDDGDFSRGDGKTTGASKTMDATGATD